MNKQAKGKKRAQSGVLWVVFLDDRKIIDIAVKHKYLAEYVARSRGSGSDVVRIAWRELPAKRRAK